MATHSTKSITDVSPERDMERSSSQEKEAGMDSEDANIVDFDGPNDPLNPMNWSSPRKVTAIVIVTAMTLLSPLGSTIAASATLDVLQHFSSTSQTLGSFVTTVFLLGYVFGPILLAPLSEIYGRAPLYKICMFGFIIFNIACALAPNLDSLIAFRFFAGVMGSCPITIGTGTVADLLPPEKRAGAMAAYIIGVVLGPSIGPIAGGYLTPAAGWRWSFWLMTICLGVLLVIAVLFVQESYPYVLLEKKTRRLRKETGNMELRSKLDTGKTPRELFAFSIFRPLKMLLSPIVFSLSLYAAIVYSYLYLCFTTFETVFGGQYGFNSGAAGVATLGLGIGAIIGTLACGAIGERSSKYLTAKHGGDPKPEYRLSPMIIGALFMPIGLFWYGWSAEAKTHWIVPILGTGFIGASMCMIYMASTLYLVHIYTVYAASVTASSTIFRCLVGALLPLAGPSMYQALGLGWGNSVLGFIAVAFIPLPFLFFLYGERMRNANIWEITL